MQVSALRGWCRSTATALLSGRTVEAPGEGEEPEASGHGEDTRASSVSVCRTAFACRLERTCFAANHEASLLAIQILFGWIFESAKLLTALEKNPAAVRV
jgi:hypothetical protein